LGPAYAIYRIGPRRLWPIDYKPKAEIFAGETNYLALREPA
jgi:hypothetical protein